MTGRRQTVLTRHGRALPSLASQGIGRRAPPGGLGSGEADDVAVICRRSFERVSAQVALKVQPRARSRHAIVRPTSPPGHLSTARTRLEGQRGAHHAGDGSRPAGVGREPRRILRPEPAPMQGSKVPSPRPATPGRPSPRLCLSSPATRRDTGRSGARSAGQWPPSDGRAGRGPVRIVEPGPVPIQESKVPSAVARCGPQVARARGWPARHPPGISMLLCRQGSGSDGAGRPVMGHSGFEGGLL